MKNLEPKYMITYTEIQKLKKKNLKNSEDLTKIY